MDTPSSTQSDIVYAIVDCPEGPHETIAFMVLNQEEHGIALVFCPTHRKILNQNTPVSIKEWVTEQELQERGFGRLA